MRAALRRICTIDGDDPTNYTPAEPDRLAVVLRLFVGPSPGEGDESFDVTICSPLWLRDTCDRDGFVLGRHHFVVRAYNFDFISAKLAKLIERYSGVTWKEVAAKVGRIGYWEFEDYDDRNSRPSVSKDPTFGQEKWSQLRCGWRRLDLDVVWQFFSQKIPPHAVI